MKTHKHYNLACQAHRGTSFSPEKRAETYINGLESELNTLRELGASGDSLRKLESLWCDWMSAKGRCMSSMITGPANFPVRRAEKANKSEHNKSTAYYDYFNKVKGAIEKEQHYAKHPEARPISASDTDALSRLKDKLSKLEAERDQNNKINKIIRRKPKNEATPEKLEELKAMGFDDRAVKLFEPDFCGRVGVPSYVNQNLGGNIKTVKGRIAGLERAKESESTKEEIAEGVSYIKDVDAMRIYFEFDGKPEEATRTLLKRNGFRWTPSQGHWGRKLTSNAEFSAKHIARELRNN